MGTNCALCTDSASIEFLLPRKWASYISEELEVSLPGDETFSMPLCGTHLHEIHQLKIRFEEQTGFDLDDYEDIETAVRRTLTEAPTTAFEKTTLE